jgi:putative flippase GtrA
MNRPLVLSGVLAYSLLVAALRRFGVIGTTGTIVLFAIMVADLAATHWLMRRAVRRR